MIRLRDSKYVLYFGDKIVDSSKGGETAPHKVHAREIIVALTKGTIFLANRYETGE